jgi:hypothetical protein
MMAKRNNVAAILAVTLFFMLGCGQPPMNMVDADSGPDIMDDGGMDVDTGVPPNPDGGMPDEDGGGGDTCTPGTRVDDPLCESATECVCDTSDFDCVSNPEMCRRVVDVRNHCEPGRNHCGDDAPLDMASYMGPGPMADCMAFVDFDVWFGGGETTLRSFWRSGQLIIAGGGFGEFMCSHDGRCYQNWSYENDPENAPDSGSHSWFEISPDCRRITGEKYFGWLGQTEPDAAITMVYRRAG